MSFSTVQFNSMPRMHTEGVSFTPISMPNSCDSLSARTRRIYQMPQLTLGHLLALPDRIFTPLNPLTLSQTLSPTFTGSFLPLRHWSTSHNPTTNSSRPNMPSLRPFTSCHTSASVLIANWLLLQISLTTRAWTQSRNSGSESNKPLFAAHNPSYRFRSRSVMLSRQRLRSPSACLLGCFFRM